MKKTISDAIVMMERAKLQAEDENITWTALEEAVLVILYHLKNST